MEEMREIIEALVKEKKYFEIRKQLNELNGVEISEIINDFEIPEVVIMIFRLLKKDKAAVVFPYLDSEHQEMIIYASTDIETKNIFDELYFDDIVDIIEEMPADVVKKILKNTNAKDRHLINQLLKYPEYSAGSIMTTEYVDLEKGMKVAEAIDCIRKTGKDKENIYTCYVTNEEGKLEGVISLKELIGKKDDTLIEDVMECSFASVLTNSDREEVEQEATEDFHKMAGITATVEEPYLKTNVFTVAKQRIGWLAVLMISDTISGNIIQGYEKVLAQSIILTAFVPMLMSTGGNVGSQSSTVVIRSLALGEISPKDAFRVLKKEFSISLMVAVVLSLLNFFRLIWFEKIDMMIALTVSVTLIFTVIVSKIVGALLPLGAKILKTDPAVMATPLITTISDAVTLIIYFKFATIFLKIG